MSLSAEAVISDSRLDAGQRQTHLFIAGNRVPS